MGHVLTLVVVGPLCLVFGVISATALTALHFTTLRKRAEEVRQKKEAELRGAFQKGMDQRMVDEIMTNLALLIKLARAQRDALKDVKGKPDIPFFGDFVGARLSSFECESSLLTGEFRRLSSWFKSLGFHVRPEPDSYLPDPNAVE